MAGEIAELQGAGQQAGASTGIQVDGQGGKPAAEPAKPALRRLNVNGRPMDLTQEQVDAAANKYLAGEDKLREAHEYEQATLRRTAHRDKFAEIGELLTKAVRENDFVAARGAMIGLGYPEQIVDAQLAQMRTGASHQPNRGGGAVAGQEVEQLRSELGQLVQVVKALGDKAQGFESNIDRLDAAHIGNVEKDIIGIVRSSVRAHDKLGAYVRKTGPRADRIHDMVWAAVRRRAQEDPKLGLESLKEQAIAEVLAACKDLDIPTGPPIPPIPGIGPAPSLASYPSEAPKPVSINDQGHAKNVLDRMRAEVVRRHMEETEA